MSNDTTNRNQAKRLIIELMLDGDIDPGTAISERSLSEKTGLGRTPVREALRDLERDGLIGIEPKRGSFMRKLGLDDVREIFEVRFAMETLAASLAALRGPNPQLRDIHDQFLTLQGRDLSPEENALAVRLGHEMHTAIVASAGNSLLEAQYAQVRLMIEVSLRLTAKREDARFDQALAEHIEIASAILTGDTEAAQDAMREHLRNGYEFRLRTLTEFPAVRTTLTLKA